VIVDRRVWYKFAVIFDPHRDAKAPADGRAPSSADESTTDDIRMDITFLLNGRPVTLNVFPDELLLQVLYDVYDIDFAHDGCHAGTCGTCTSVVNGVLVKICVLPMRDVAGKSVYVKVKNGARRGRRDGKRQG